MHSQEQPVLKGNMAILVNTPELPQPNGIVTWWDKQVGDTVYVGELLVEIRNGARETAVKAWLAGTLLHIFAKAGTEVNTGDRLAILGEPGENVAQLLTNLNPTIEQSIPASSDLGVQPAPDGGSSFNVIRPEEKKQPVISPVADSSGGSSFGTHNPAPLGQEPTTNFSADGSSFTFSGENKPSQPTPSGLTTEQTRNLSTYGRGFDRFVKLRLIPQQGAMGELFFATIAVSGREVVIKRIRPEKRNDAKAKEYFVREINLGSLIPYHPHIVNILFSDQNEYGPYYVMERVNGPSLQHLVEKQPLSPDKVRRLLVGILEGARHIHGQYVVHRDLKPLNILVDTAHWVAKIIDFGFAKHGAYPDLDVFNMGTPGYMAPEQQGDPNTVDVRADIYALGCILYFMLTGESPPAMNLAAVKDPVYRKIIERCTQTDPAGRFGSAQEILDALQAPVVLPEPAKVKAEPNPSLAGFRTLMNELILEWLPSEAPLSGLTVRLIQKQATLAGLQYPDLEAELNDFRELYREVVKDGPLTPFKRRTLLLQGELLQITEATIDQLLQQSMKPAAIPPREKQPISASPVHTPPPVPQAENTGSGYSRGSTPSAVTAFPVTRYGRAVGLFDGFDEDKLTTDRRSDSLFEITISSPSEASYRVTDNTLAQETALDNKRYYLLPACELVQVYPSMDPAITTVEPGKLYKQGSIWKISQKAKIKIG